MSARQRWLLGWACLIAALVTAGYVALEVILMVRGDLLVGPLRVIDLVLISGSAVCLVYLGRLLLRTPPRS